MLVSCLWKDLCWYWPVLTDCISPSLVVMQCFLAVAVTTCINHTLTKPNQEWCLQPGIFNSSQVKKKRKLWIDCWRVTSTRHQGESWQGEEGREDGTDLVTVLMCSAETLDLLRLWWSWNNSWLWGKLIVSEQEGWMKWRNIDELSTDHVQPGSSRILQKPKTFFLGCGFLKSEQYRS